MKEKMVKYYLQKLRFEHMMRVYEWSKYKSEQTGEEFKNDDQMLTLTVVIQYMNKFLYKGIDNAILDSEYLKKEKAQKAENKHAKEGGTHSSKHRTSNSPNKGKSRPETGKAKVKYHYIPLEQKFLEWKYPPGFIFEPSKREIQIMLKKQTTLKSIEDIVLDTRSILESGG